MPSVAITTLGNRIFKELAHVVNEKSAQVDAELKRKIGQQKIHELENDKQSICHSE